MRHATSLSEKKTLCFLQVLPRDGELVLGDYASIAFPAGSAQDNNCPGTGLKSQ